MTAFFRARRTQTDAKGQESFSAGRRKDPKKPAPKKTTDPVNRFPLYHRFLGRLDPLLRERAAPRPPVAATFLAPRFAVFFLRVDDLVDRDEADFLPADLVGRAEVAVGFLRLRLRRAGLPEIKRFSSRTSSGASGR